MGLGVVKPSALTFRGTANVFLPLNSTSFPRFSPSVSASRGAFALSETWDVSFEFPEPSVEANHTQVKYYLHQK